MYIQYKKNIYILCIVICMKINIYIINAVKTVCKRHSREPEHVALMSSCPLYTGQNYMHYL